MHPAACWKSLCNRTSKPRGSARADHLIAKERCTARVKWHRAEKQAQLLHVRLWASSPAAVPAQSANKKFCGRTRQAPMMQD
eukprot:2716423-Pyramimonas_sp.AAC.1